MLPCIAVFTLALILAVVWQMRPVYSPARSPAPPRPAAAARSPLIAPLQNLPQPSLTASVSTNEPSLPIQSFDGVIGQAVRLSASASPEEATRLAAAMADLGPSAVDELGSAMQSASSLPAKTAVAQALALIGTSEAVDQLVPGLLSIPDPAQRAIATQALDSLSDPIGLETLTSALATSDDPILLHSINAAISRMATGDTVQFLTELYRAQPQIPSQPDGVAAALSTITSPDATDALRQIVSTAPELTLQTAAANSLALTGTADALEGLVGGLFRVGDTNPSYRQTLLTLLANVSNPESASWLQSESASPNLPADVMTSLNTALGNIRRQSSAGR
jgi:HEAT repeat protein